MKLKNLIVTAFAGVSLVASNALAQTPLDRSHAWIASHPMSHMGMMQDMMIGSEFEYLSQMIPHHQEAIDTAKRVLEYGDSPEGRLDQRPEMREFLQNIIEVQTAEIEQMKIWLNQWYPGQTSTQTYTPMMRDLSQLEGDELNKAFLEDMTMHHMGAVMMSQVLLNHNLVEHEAVIPFAQQIATSQRHEIHQMNVWLQEWFDEAGVDGMSGHAGRYMGESPCRGGMNFGSEESFR